MNATASINPQELRAALATFATGITIVTTRDAGGRDVGLTVNSFSSVSLKPPMVLWSLSKDSHCRAAFLADGHFAVHVLAADQAAMCSLFARRGADKFCDLEPERGIGGIPLLPGSAARFQCRTVFRCEGGDHDILVGEVLSFECFHKSALVFHAGRLAVALDRPAAIDRGPDAISDDPEGIPGISTLQYLLLRAYFQLQLGVRPELARNELSEIDNVALSTIVYRSPCTAADVIDVLATCGYRLTTADLDRLVCRGLVTMGSGADPAALVQISPTGRQLLIRIAAITKSVESDAVHDLDYTEVQVLKELMRKIIRRTSAPWQKPI